ncbi:unnamed protein product [Protopolystoma xenopodis]|uniref:Uncharacterized protein n=1 Tax=Protopolystoma xenopodis TaxID=117903 RepID=A0A3S5BKT4_9PLAT|nr:unnamed protein product [Protopolystoma xenopodis]
MQRLFPIQPPFADYGMDNYPFCHVLIPLLGQAKQLRIQTRAQSRKGIFQLDVCQSTDCLASRFHLLQSIANKHTGVRPRTIKFGCRLRRQCKA